MLHLFSVSARFKLAVCLSSVVAASCLFSGKALGQDPRSGERSFAEEMADVSEKPFEDQFWKYLIGNNYKNWAPGPGQNGDFYVGQNPHGALLKMYLNRTAAGRTNDFPMGSVVILENYRADKSLKTISVMYRTTGFNPQGNDWYWVDYNPDGTVVKAVVTKPTVSTVSHDEGEGQLKKTMGRATNCMSCHQSGEGEDYVFFNDRALLVPGMNQERIADKTNAAGQ